MLLFLQVLICNWFKKNLFTTLYSGLLKKVVSRYIQHGSSVFACFLDASKAFDHVRHDYSICSWPQVLSPILFWMYPDKLLMELHILRVGCYWDHHFTGAMAYADYVVLLAPCVSAVRLLLSNSESFALGRGCFNPSTTLSDTICSVLIMLIPVPCFFCNSTFAVLCYLGKIK